MSMDFKVFLCEEFTPSQLEVNLHERLNLYYQQTPNEMDNRDALPHWIDFKKWCFKHGYTQEEINRAKRKKRI